MGDTLEQKAFIEYDGSNSIILSATAGSGKTYSTVKRFQHLIEQGVDPNRIIMFSFTNDAVNELKSRIDTPVQITTIHSFCATTLGKMKKFKSIKTFWEYVNWYKGKYKPSTSARQAVKDDYYDYMDRLYESGDAISSQFSAYKLQSSEGVAQFKPKKYDSYVRFLRETKGMDFADLIIQVTQLSKTKEFKDMYLDKYDHVFIDEYQDTSIQQLRILLELEAPQYYLIGDKNQMIFSFGGADCAKIENLLKEHKEVREMTLSKNFRSDKRIVENANKYSSLKAEPTSHADGHIDFNVIGPQDLKEMAKDGKPLTILVRTNNVIKDLELSFLKARIPMRYFNYIKKTELEAIKKGKETEATRRKLIRLVSAFPDKNELVQFIEENQDSDVFITTIHKSKGREFPRCVVVNSIDPDVLEENKDNFPFLFDVEQYTFMDDFGVIDQEAKNIHYVAVTRPKNELYFMLTK